MFIIISLVIVPGGVKGSNIEGGVLIKSEETTFCDVCPGWVGEGSEKHTDVFACMKYAARLSLCCCLEIGAIGVGEVLACLDPLSDDDDGKEGGGVLVWG